MKDPLERTKVVLRHLPPAISQSALMEQIDSRFAGRYKWVCFHPGRNSQKNQRFSRSYIDFKKSEDVVEFAEFFDGHVFVNEKGAQFKAIVEYSPSQRVPKSSKKDGREGTISKDPEYLEFLEILAKPAENLPSAEIQLERREAERAGGAKETLIVTPLMDFIRQKRAAKSGSQRLSASGKLSRRSGVSSNSSSPSSSKRGSEKRRVTTSMYVLRDSTKNGGGKNKSTYILLPRPEEQQSSDKIDTVVASGTKALEDETGASVTANGTGMTETGKKRALLLKGKEREVSHASSGSPQQQITASPAGNLSGPAAFKQLQRHEGSGRMIRSMLSKEARQSLPQTATNQSGQQMPTLNSEKDKRPPRPSNSRLPLKDNASNSLHGRVTDVDKRRFLDDKVSGNDAHCSVSISEKQDKRTRNKDRPDRGVWAPLRRSDGSNVSDDSLSSSSSLSAQVLSDSLEGMSVSQQVAGIGKTVDDDSVTQSSRLGRGTGSLPAYDMLSHGEMKGDMRVANKTGEIRSLGGGRGNHSVSENGSHRHVGRRGQAHGMKEVDGSLIFPEAKISKRGATVYGSHEKQVWVQKSGSGS